MTSGARPGPRIGPAEAVGRGPVGEISPGPRTESKPGSRRARDGLTRAAHVFREGGAREATEYQGEHTMPSTYVPRPACATACELAFFFRLRGRWRGWP